MFTIIYILFIYLYLKVADVQIYHKFFSILSSSILSSGDFHRLPPRMYFLGKYVLFYTSLYRTLVQSCDSRPPTDGQLRMRVTRIRDYFWISECPVVYE